LHFFKLNILDNIENNISVGVIEALKSLYCIEISFDKVVLAPTDKTHNGDFTVVVFPFVKQAKQSPEKIGQDIGSFLKENILEIVGFEVIKGFLNLTVSQEYWFSFFSHASNNDKFGYSDFHGKKVMVEYSSPNTNKPLHLGHIRNNVLGYAISGIFKANGYDVCKSNLINDRGIHICKSMLAWQKWGSGETPESTGMKGDHLIGKYYVIFDKEYKKEIVKLIASGMPEEKAKNEASLMKEARTMLQQWEDGNDEVVVLWKKMNGWAYQGFDVTYKRLGVDFDKFYYESETYLLGKKVVEEGLSKNIFYRKEDGSVWIDLTTDGLDEKLLLRSDGTSVYITQDIGTADYKYQDFPMEKSVYVVGNEQDYHFKVLKLIMQKLGRPYADGIEHFSYGMVELPSGKMKSREGTVVDADDLMDEMIEAAKEQTIALGKVSDFNDNELVKLYETIGLSALKFFLLRVDPKKTILFDPQASIDLHGYTATFVQYTYVRTRSICRKFEQTNGKDFGHLQKIDFHPIELALIKFLYHYPKAISEAADEMNPAKVIDYTFELAKLYNKFFAELPVLNAEKEVALIRVALSRMVGDVIQRSFKMLGMDVPERM
jgi:arginyl-tRNA synthetase